jgi:hypothetical protein
MTTLWAVSLDLDHESPNSAHLFSRHQSERIIHILETLPRTTGWPSLLFTIQFSPL